MGFFRQNGPERFQAQDWYPNEKMVVVHVCLNVGAVFQNDWVLYHIKKDEVST